MPSGILHEFPLRTPNHRRPTRNDEGQYNFLHGKSVTCQPIIIDQPIDTPQSQTIVIHGPAGVGKTHYIYSLAQPSDKPPTFVIYMDCALFRDHFVRSLATVTEHFKQQIQAAKQQSKSLTDEPRQRFLHAEYAKRDDAMKDVFVR